MSSKFKNLAVASSLIIIGAMTLPTFSASQVPSGEKGIDLVNYEDTNVTKDDIGSTKDVDMYAVQHPEDIILSNGTNFEVELKGSGWLESEKDDAMILNSDSFTGDEQVVYKDVATYYDPEIGDLRKLDMTFDITGYNRSTMSKSDEVDCLMIYNQGSNAEIRKIDQKNNDVSFDLSFYDSETGELITNRNVEMLWEDMDANAHISYETDSLTEIIAPYSESVNTGITDLSNPYLYMGLDDILAISPEIMNARNSIYGTSGLTSESFKDYRLGAYDNDDGQTIVYDRWSTGAAFTDSGLEVYNDILDETYQSMPNVGVSPGSKYIQNSPGQNFTVIANLGDDGKLSMTLGNAYEFSHKADQGNTVYLASPSIANTKVSKSIDDSDNDNVAENGDILTYTLDIENQSDTTVAYMTHIKDSLIESVPIGLSFNDDVSIDNGELIGDTSTGNFYIKEIEPSAKVEITYSFTVNDINAYLQSGENIIDNIATDNGAEPLICNEIDNGVDCGEAVINPNGYTDITKSVLDENEDGIFQVGEILTYDIHLENNSGYDAYDVLVRDSIFEMELPSYLEISNIELHTSGFNIETTGDLQTGDLMIERVPSGESVDITYSLKLTEQPDNEEVVSIINVVTDNGENPETCDDINNGLDCDETITPIEPEAIINKSVSDENGDGIVQDDEVLTYEINVRNENKLPTTNIAIRDSLLEDLPDYVDFNNNPTIEGSKFDVETSGDLSKGDFSINEIPGKSSVKISYELKVNDIPEDVESLLNIVTDNGEDPEVCESEDKGIDCDEAIIPTDPNTVINKTVVDDNKDGIVQDNEVLTYKINVANESKITAKNVIIRDSLLENLPEYVTLEEEPIATGSKFDVKTTGNLTSGDFTIVEIPAKSNVVITYSLKVDEVPKDIETILNIVTDNGDDPLVCKDEDKSKDCDEAVIPTHVETLIEKTVTDENEDGIVQDGEVLNYLITVTNPTGNNISDVNVRDSLLENLPEYLTYNEDLKINPTETKSSGDLSKGDFTLETV
ncbi:MAG: hypothetical protein ACK5N4_19750, partial [Parabacteroides gordonii]|uniref:hypothetical protein n=1 Tax=Parabacteroides gordonii TaxID=574930 RepID=UPI003A854F74